MKNTITGITTWDQVCGISRKMTAGLGYYAKGFSSSDRKGGTIMIVTYPRLDLVYVADDSIGGREWTTEGDPSDTRNSFDGNYFGWNQEQSTHFKWTSASSGATIEAQKLTTGTWEVTFTGSENPERESVYGRIFLSCHFLKVTNSDLPKRELLAELLNGQ